MTARQAGAGRWPQLLRLSLLVWLTVACQAATPGADEQPAVLGREEPARLTHRAGDVVGSLAWREKANALALAIETDTPRQPTSVPMTDRVNVWRPLLQQFFDQHGGNSYLLTVGEYPELAARVATAAACSGQWGEPRGASRAAAEKATALFADLRLYPELVGLLGELHYALAVESAESVVLCAWERFRDPEGACGRTLGATVQVPCGASLTFRVTTSR